MNEPEKEIQASDEESRREFLVKAGKFAIYTPPAVMLLMHPSKDALARSGNGGGGGGVGGGNNRRKNKRWVGGNNRRKNKRRGSHRIRNRKNEKGHK